MANVYPCGLVINPKFPWLGSSPDRTVYDIEAAQNGSSDPFGLFESKVVQEGLTSFDAVSYLKRDPVTNELTLKENHIYYLQVQCQLGTTGLDCCDFFCYINDDFFFVNELNSNLLFSSKVKTELTTFISTIFCEG